MADIYKTREFVLKRKLRSFRNKVEVMDPDKNILGYFKGKIISIGNTYRLYLPDDTPIMTIDQKLISMRSVYSFYWGADKDDEKYIGKMKRKLLSFKPKLWFEDKDGNEIITMKGKVFRQNFELYKEGKEFAEIRTKMFKIRSTYGLRITPDASDEDALLALAIVIMVHSEKGSKTKSSNRKKALRR